MRYMLLITIDAGAPPLEAGELERILDGHRRFEAELRASKTAARDRVRDEGRGDRVGEEDPTPRGSHHRGQRGVAAMTIFYGWVTH